MEPGVFELFVRILQDAEEIILCGAESNKHRNIRMAIEELNWVSSENTTYIFSFRFVCSILSIDPKKRKEKIISDFLQKREHFMNQQNQQNLLSNTKYPLQ